MDASHPNCQAVQQALDDAGAAGQVRILPAGGVPHAVFPTTFDELVRITRGQSGGDCVTT